MYAQDRSKLGDVVNDVDAIAVLSKSGASFRDGAASCDLGARSLKIAMAIVEALETEQERFDGTEPAIRLMARLFEALDALFDRANTSTPIDQPAAYRAFLGAIEAGLGASHRVTDYARDLPYSERTITRACQRVTGLTAKGVLNQRITPRSQTTSCPHRRTRRHHRPQARLQ